MQSVWDRPQQRLQDSLAMLPNLRADKSSTAFLETFSCVLNLSVSLQRWQEGRKAIAESLIAWEDGLFANDELFLLIHHSANFYSALGEHSEVITLYIQAANRFSDVQAYQSAYRLLEDANQYAATHGDAVGQLRITEAIAPIALIEGDLAYAEKAFRKLRRIREAQKLPLPTELIVNLAVLLLRNGKYSKAARALRRLLAGELKADVRFGALLNLGVCLREMGKLDESRSALASARTLSEFSRDNQMLIELELVQAKTAANTGDSEELFNCLLNAVARIDAELLPSGRLHHRRGIRARYRQRIVELFCLLPKNGSSERILPIISLIKANSVADWLALLDWRERMLTHVEIPQSMHAQLLTAISGVARYGAPSLYGYREKYDDPWSTPWRVCSPSMASEPEWGTTAWTDLNNVVREMQTLARDDGPWLFATSAAVAHNLQFQLVQSEALIVVLFANRTIQLLVANAESYSRYEFSEPEFMDLQRVLAGFQLGEESREVFANALMACVKLISERLKEEMDSLAASGIARIMVLPEQLEMPVIGALMAHPGIRERAKEAALTLAVCPVLYPKSSTTFKPSSLTTCGFKADELKLSDHEARLVARLLKPSAVQEVQLPAEMNEDLLSSEVFHVAAHGTPVSNLRDAFFSNAHPSQAFLNVNDLQTVACFSNHRIVFLNTCFSSDTANWNLFSVFQTNEQIGFPTTFLLNRRSVVVASRWKTFDLTAYVFSFGFYTGLRKGLDPGIAFTKALAEMYEVSADQAKTILDSVTDDEIRAKKQASLQAGTRPFSHPYVSGTYQFVSLL